MYRKLIICAGLLLLGVLLGAGSVSFLWIRSIEGAAPPVSRAAPLPNDDERYPWAATKTPREIASKARAGDVIAYLNGKAYLHQGIMGFGHSPFFHTGIFLPNERPNGTKIIAEAGPVVYVEATADVGVKAYEPERRLIENYGSGVMFWQPLDNQKSMQFNSPSMRNRQIQWLDRVQGNGYDYASVAAFILSGRGRHTPGMNLVDFDPSAPIDQNNLRVFLGAYGWNKWAHNQRARLYAEANWRDQEQFVSAFFCSEFVATSLHIAEILPPQILLPQEQPRDVATYGIYASEYYKVELEPDKSEKHSRDYAKASLEEAKNFFYTANSGLIKCGHHP